VANLAPTEIKALARIVDELDYYQLIHVERGASARDVKQAYYATSRAFHPDANRDLAAELTDAVARISKRVTEAYAVLRDPRRRQAYDRQLEAQGGLRMQLGHADAEAERQLRENDGRTPQGRQYYTRARADLARGDLASAARNLQTALTFEPDNTGFREQLADLRKRLR
jgi:DnaJ-class molecular chaperone